MELVKDIAKGAVIGVANIIPGVSGGTMAVSLGIYDRLIYALTEFFKNPGKSIRTLAPIALGVALGIVGFTYAVEFLLRQYALPTTLAFLGLILGGIPMLWRRYRGNLGGRLRPPASNLIAFLALFCLSAFLPMLHHGEDLGGELAASIPSLLLLVLIGAIASATMVIPGISGSMVLMILGYYYRIINSLKSFFDALASLDIGLALRLAIPLFFFGVGVLLGIFFIAKCIRYLFEKHGVVTYSGILGLIAAAPVAIFTSTGSLGDLALPSGMTRLAVGVAVMLLCFLAVYLPDKRSA